MEGEREMVSLVTHSFCAEKLKGEGKVIWVDGGNVIDPLLLLRLLRSGRQSPRGALDRIILARAFTAYQMSAIIEGRLRDRTVEESPSLVIVSSLGELFQDPDVDRRESRELLSRALDVLQDISRSEESPVLVSGCPLTCPRVLRVRGSAHGLSVKQPGGA